MNDENTESTQPSLGQTLKTGREVAGVSLEQLAKTLKLSVLQLQHLENDEHHLLGPATFVKGYAKCYCREFNLDNDTVMALFPENQETVKKSKMQSFSKRTEKEAHDSRLMLVSYIILAIAIGSSALWWWQNSTPLNQQTVTKPVIDLSTQDITQTQSQPVNTDDQQIELVQPETNTPEQPIQMREEPVSEPVQQEQNGLSTVVMLFNEDSWVEIHDGEGEKVAFGVKKAGYEMTVTGTPPFSVVLGKHQVVEITLNGEAIDISNFPKNRLAKFNLPLAE
ncbi:RodZ domain-containing protein [Pseudoalteromonas sp. H105]|jgi:cytoskeleton protein RodZ|uniref:RodZ domain-containing protein n=1 Tax=Pseudoalteromonas sp. H105 TaxID=1348393 RepID=UPI0007323373|nr:RodZ domain-containing protein [Pseudoalteromonas sp. H105]KTF13013.1 transcriptional regulator [Pseudoalteromonas sp. H105]